MSGNLFLKAGLAVCLVGCRAPHPVPAGGNAEQTETVKEQPEPAPTTRENSTSPPDSSKAPPPPSAPCRGTATQEMVQAISTKAAESRRCYNVLLGENPKMMGRLVVHLSLNEDGTLRTPAKVINDEIGDADLNSCVEQVLNTDFVETPPVGGCLVINVPLNFSSKKDDDN